MIGARRFGSMGRMVGLGDFAIHDDRQGDTPAAIVLEIQGRLEMDRPDLIGENLEMNLERLSALDRPGQGRHADATMRSTHFGEPQDPHRADAIIADGDGTVMGGLLGQLAEGDRNRGRRNRGFLAPNALAGSEHDDPGAGHDQDGTDGSTEEMTHPD